jgi:pimeloyl-ACP methyl ester carboxylesterase
MPRDGATGIWWESHGEGPAVFIGLPLMASQADVFGTPAQAMLDAWLDALSGYRVLLADYPGIGRSDDHDPATMTAERVVADLLAVADAAGIDHFAWVGYSWSGAVGLQLATRSDRLTALAIGGWPPLDAPYPALLRAIEGRIGNVPDHAMKILRTPDQYRQWASFYGSLAGWPEKERVAGIACPKMLFFGAEGDLIEDEEAVPIASLARRHRAALEGQGWEVHEIPGHGHDVIGHSALVLPPIRAFLDRNIGVRT